MKSFQILDKEGKAINLKELDIEVAKFWGKEIDNKQWSNPYEEVVQSETISYIDAVQQNQRNYSFNWFDTIGWQITQLPSHNVSWSAVAEAIIHDHVMSSVLNMNDGKLSLTSVELSEESSLDNIILTSTDKNLSYLPVVLKMFKSHINLINYFIEQGYKPKQL